MLAKLLNSIDNYDELAAMADRAPSGCRGLRFGQKANVLDAALIVREAWDELEAESIAACWSHSGCLPLIQHCDVTASRNGYRKQVESSAIADMAKLLEKIDLTNDGSRKAIRELGLDEVTTVMSSDDKHQVIQRWLSLENDPEVIAFEDIDPQKLQIKENHRHRLHQSNPQKLRHLNHHFLTSVRKLCALFSSCSPQMFPLQQSPLDRGFI